jgi:hypothetical protein
MNAWVDSYDFKQIDYDQWLLSKMGEVTEQDAMNDVIPNLIPFFSTAWLLLGRPRKQRRFGGRFEKSK